MNASRLVGLSFVVALAAVGLSCATDQESAGPSAIEFAGGPVEQSLTAAATTAAEDAALKRLLDSERARTKLAQAASRRVYDSLSVVWNQFKRDNPRVGRNNSPFPICQPKTYSAESKIIGPNGGQIAMGTHHLIIPKGALLHNTVITGERPVSTLIEVELSPAGTTFLKRATLQLNYGECFLPPNYQYRVAYIDDDNKILEYPVSVDEGSVVEALIWHFSRYAVAW